MVDSGPQWEAVLRRQKEKNQADPNNRRSRHRSRSYVGSFSTFPSKPGSLLGAWQSRRTGAQSPNESCQLGLYIFIGCFLLTRVTFTNHF